MHRLVKVCGPKLQVIDMRSGEINLQGLSIAQQYSSASPISSMLLEFSALNLQQIRFLLHFVVVVDVSSVVAHIAHESAEIFALHEIPL